MVVKTNNKVTIEYEGKLESGEVFDSSKKAGKPLEFVTGSGMVIPGFDEGVIGMEKGEEKELNIESDKAYGPYREEMKKEFPKESLPKEPEPKVGMVLVLTTPQGQQIPAKIAKVEADKVIIDLNHPLAGKKLIFKIKLVDYSKGEVEDKKDEKKDEDKKDEKKDDVSIEDLAEGK
ncbi:peptidylprolyl isomerase [Candidatus Pacearchaeota archaeon]|nr:peptidylprolyl isomerase [Candidatus Pacearchaeota archaeon]